MAERIKIEGLKELDSALAQLPRSTGKNVLRKVLKKVAQPIADQASGIAPYKTGELQSSIAVSTKLSKRQAKLHRKMFKDDKAAVEMFVGAGAVPQAHLREFGGGPGGPDPFMRPAWDSNKHKVLETIKEDLWNEISKAAARLAKKTAKLR
jgi:HK97 gp10 family phage protein